MYIMSSILLFGRFVFQLYFHVYVLYVYVYLDLSTELYKVNSL